MKLKITYFKFYLLLFFLSGLVSYGQTIRYVKETASGSGNGTSWENASSNLQVMMNLSVTGDQIWVAAGTYKPERAPNNLEIVTLNNRNNAFIINNGIEVYGGFPASGVPVWEDRDWVANNTILSGDLGSPGNESDNTYHVVVTAGLNEALSPKTKLDGFTITGGNANEPTAQIETGNGYPIYHRGGGGIYNAYGYTSIDNCLITGNKAIEGGGIYNSSYINTVLNNVSIKVNIGTMGGGIFNGFMVDLKINNVVVSNNTADLGGGMYNGNTSAVQCENVIIESNSATDGGGIYNYYSSGITLHNITLSNNNASSNGGGIYNYQVLGWDIFESAPTFKNITLTGNTAVNGGAIYNDTSIFKLEDVIISNNTASGNGGGILNNSSGPVLRRVSIRGNSAINGGGIYTFNVGAENILVNVELAGNRASNNGGGIHNSGSSLKLMNTTITGNNAVSGGGIYNQAPTFAVTNTVIYGNSSGLFNTSTSTTFANSLIQGLTNTSNGNFNGTIDPLFMAPASFSNAPTTQGNYSVRLNSPLVNSGNTYVYNTFEFGFNPNDLDIAGNLRIYNYDIGLPIDIGAYEYTITPDVNGILYVKAGATGNGSSWDDASGDLQAMIDAKNVQQIWMGAGTYKPIRNIANLSVIEFNNRDNSFVIQKNIKIYGGFPSGSPSFEERDWNTNVTILSGDLGIEGDISDNSFNVMIVHGNSGERLSETVLNGLTIAHGNANGVIYSTGVIDVLQFHGGGMNNHYADIMLENVIIRNNTAIYPGGGMYNLRSSPIIKNSIISGNSSQDTVGGGMYNNANSHAQLTNVLITGNVSGGMYNFTSSPILTNVTISGNTGLAINNFQISNPIIRNSIIAGNEAANEDIATTFNSFLSGVTVDDENGNIDGTLDPLFVNAPSYTTAPFTGGDYSLQSNSPLIDKGSNSLYLLSGYNPVTDTDLAGNYRIYHYANGGIIDIGTYENNTCATSLPLAIPLSFCSGSTVANLAATGANLLWYAAATEGEPLNSAVSLQTGTYYVSQTINGCESSRLPVEVSVSVVPAPSGPVTQTVGTNLPQNATIADLIAEGENIQWYVSEEDIQNNIPLLSTTPLVNNTQYYGTQTIDDCESTPLIVTVTSVMGVNNFDISNLTYYPNPVVKDLHIKYTANIDVVVVYTLTGQKVIEEYWNLTESKLDLSSLSEGSYMVNIVTGNVSKNFMIIKVIQ